MEFVKNVGGCLELKSRGMAMLAGLLAWALIATVAPRSSSAQAKATEHPELDRGAQSGLTVAQQWNQAAIDRIAREKWEQWVQMERMAAQRKIAVAQKTRDPLIKKEWVRDLVCDHLTRTERSARSLWDKIHSNCKNAAQLPQGPAESGAKDGVKYQNWFLTVSGFNGKNYVCKVPLAWHFEYYTDVNYSAKDGGDPRVALNPEQRKAVIRDESRPSSYHERYRSGVRFWMNVAGVSPESVHCPGSENYKCIKFRWDSWKPDCIMRN